MGSGWVFIEQTRRQSPTNQLHDINWDILDHASQALQLS